MDVEHKPDPANYTSEEDWMEACVPAMVGEGREQEQAVAACLNIWRERDAKAITVRPIIRRI